jgi:hypothetical protein
LEPRTGPKTIYVRDADAPLWGRAEKHAEATGGSLAGVVAAALRSYLPEQQRRSQNVETITVDVGHGSLADLVPTSFEGRWLIPPDDDNRSTEPDADAGACYGVAVTKRGKIALYCYHVNARWQPTLEVYDDLDQAVAEGDLPELMAAEAAKELGQYRPVVLDI